MSNFFKSLKQEKIDKGLELLDACLDDIAYARVLLSKNSHDINWKDDAGGNSILHTLVYNELCKPVQLLLKHGADPNITNKNDETPLHWCAIMNSKKCAKVLIEHKCNIDSIDNSGSTALHQAATKNNLEMIPLLLDNGASVSILDKDGMTAIELSAEGKSTAAYAVTILLLRYYQQNNIPLPKLVKKNINRFLTQPNPPPTFAPPPQTLSSTNLNSTATSGLTSAPITPLPPHLSAAYNQAIREAAEVRIQSDSEGGGGATPKHKTRKQKKPLSTTSTSDTEKVTPTPSTSGVAAAQHHHQHNHAHTASHKDASMVPIHAAPVSKSVASNTAASAAGVTPTQPLMVGSTPIPVSNCVTPTPHLEIGHHVNPFSAATHGADDTDLLYQHNSMKTIAETLFPPTAFPPILPCKASGAKYLDVVVAVEHCVDCESHNKLSLRHDSAQYIRIANEVLFGIIKSVIEQKFAIRLFAYRTKSTKYDGKLGGMEVTIAVNLTPQLSEESQHLIQKSTATHKIHNRNKHASLDFSAHARHHNKGVSGLSNIVAEHAHNNHSNASLLTIGASEEHLETSAEMKADQNWATHQIWSKIDSKCWPNLNFVKDKVIAFLNTTLKEHCNTIVNDHHSSDGEDGRIGSPSPVPHVETQYKHPSFSVAAIKEIQLQYSEWVERMKLPPIIERHKLCMDWPQLFPQVEESNSSHSKTSKVTPVIKHAQGPMLDLELKEKVKKVDFEKAMMKHFLVYDCTL